MVFNGHTIQEIDALDEATFNEIVVMYADGLIGNRSVITTLGTLTAGVFNYMRPSGSQSYDLKSVIGSAYGYIYEDIKADPSDSLLSFMSQAPGFTMDKFKGK
jgi:hypothetical protein